MPIVMAVYVGKYSCTTRSPCSLGQGHCRGDAYCAGDLQCFTRWRDEAVPGLDMSNFRRAIAVCYAPGAGGNATAANHPNSAGCYIGNGNTYLGTASVTETGRTCQNWWVNEPHNVGWEFKKRAKNVGSALNEVRARARFASQSFATQLAVNERKATAHLHLGSALC